MIRYFYELLQGSDAWLSARCGLLTASEMNRIITPTTLKYASNDKERQHLYELAAQRITQYVEPSYVNDDMLRGQSDEVYAREAYREHFAPVKECGFITNDKWGFTIGFSPDGLVGDDGLIEVKSPRPKSHLQTLLNLEMPAEHMIQVQTGMLVSERPWCDFISYSGGWPMVTLRVHADSAIQDAIVEAATVFHGKLLAMIGRYTGILADPSLKLIPTIRRVEQEIVL